MYVNDTIFRQDGGPDRIIKFNVKFSRFSLRKLRSRRFFQVSPMTESVQDRHAEDGHGSAVSHKAGTWPFCLQTCCSRPGRFR